ncbi:hypothetical protein [Enterococcus pallens]|uniref:PTS EIIB type-3 domain-containing protein n=1 Tax=Enterococcus pallens ATCC BAA-351 TaxID=1158607 RepID=R2SJX0_9ENTE|nr:hypothetical protein [Enterococcus pallens]EOH93206.1 hypothetical protein UAU_02849 [Enterococcus pallens ATCC BAA-351]EOU24992.1 hypothetical protein I588_00980 [Enterococcus pallens ATCC BAA-351]OJG76726.1 hypothetical protein RV10_GL003326 [Enterococcus pallens]
MSIQNVLLLQEHPFKWNSPPRILANILKGEFDSNHLRIKVADYQKLKQQKVSANLILIEPTAKYLKPHVERLYGNQAKVEVMELNAYTALNAPLLIQQIQENLT